MDKLTETTEIALRLVMEDAPPIEVIKSWPRKVRKEVEKWAIMIHLDASDNDVEIPNIPSVIKAWRGKDNG